MGCISSKILTKSLSFREDLSQSHRSKRNRIAASGIPPDDLFLSKSQMGNSNSLPNVEMINTWELMAGLEEEEEEEEEAETKGPITSGPGPDDIKEMLFPITNTIEESSSFKGSALELQSIGSLREWLLGCVESPRDYYVTPNYDDKSCGEEWKEEPILNPDLLAAFQRVYSTTRN